MKGETVCERKMWQQERSAMRIISGDDSIELVCTLEVGHVRGHQRHAVLTNFNSQFAQVTQAVRRVQRLTGAVRHLREDGRELARVAVRRVLQRELDPARSVGENSEDRRLLVFAGQGVD